MCLRNKAGLFKGDSEFKFHDAPRRDSRGRDSRGRDSRGRDSRDAERRSTKRLLDNRSQWLTCSVRQALDPFYSQSQTLLPLMT